MENRSVNEIVGKAARRRRLKKWVALMSVVVLFVTTNRLILLADALEPGVSGGAIYEDDLIIEETDSPDLPVEDDGQAISDEIDLVDEGEEIEIDLPDLAGGLAQNSALLEDAPVSEDEPAISGDLRDFIDDARLIGADESSAWDVLPGETYTLRLHFSESDEMSFDRQELRYALPEGVAAAADFGETSGVYGEYVVEGGSKLTVRCVFEADDSDFSMDVPVAFESAGQLDFGRGVRREAVFVEAASEDLTDAPQQEAQEPEAAPEESEQSIEEVEQPAEEAEPSIEEVEEVSEEVEIAPEEIEQPASEKEETKPEEAEEPATEKEAAEAIEQPSEEEEAAPEEAEQPAEESEEPDIPADEEEALPAAPETTEETPEGVDSEAIDGENTDTEDIDIEDAPEVLRIEIDLAEVVEYPLSMRALLGDAIVDADAALLPVAYDAELVAVETIGDDYLVTPVADFDAAVIEIGPHAVTLLNYRSAPAYPAQSFADSTDYVTVSVTADAGAFPAGTTMSLTDIDDAGTIDGITEKVEEDFVKVERVHAVDITFRDADGNEIEPLIPISVVMTVREIGDDLEAMVVHVDTEGEAQVVEDAAPTGEAEAPASSSVEFTADSFSVYAVVVAQKIETKVIAADGKTYRIEVTYAENADIPAGATLSVAEVTGDEAYLEQARESIDKYITLARFFDIKIMNDGDEVRLGAPVEVRVWLDEADVSEDATPVAVHFAQTGVETQEAREADDAVVFRADGFSVWGVAYTVDFEYYDLGFAVDENTEVKLSDILAKLTTAEDGISASEVTAIEIVGDSGGITWDKDENGKDWTISVGQRFSGQRTLKITAGNKEIELNIRCQRVDITDMLTNVKIYEKGSETVIGDSDGTPATLRTNKQYELEFTFEETSGNADLQFRDDGEEMIFRLPVDDSANPILTSLSKLGTPTMEIDLGNGLKVSGNKVTYDPEHNCIRIRWNTSDPNFQELTASPRATFTLRYLANIDLTQEIIRFNSDTSVTVIKDETFDVEVQKSAEQPDSQGRIKYTVTVKAIGDAKDIQVSDAITGDALTYIAQSAGGGVSIDVLPREDATETTDARIENLTETDKGFSLTIDQLADGETAVLTYYAQVDYSALSRYENLTETQARSDTLNTVSAKGSGDPHTSEHWFENGIPYVSVTKTPGTVKALENGKKRVQWTVTYNADHAAAVAGSKLVDSIYSGPVDAMTYDQTQPFAVTRIDVNGDEEETYTAAWGTGVEVTSFNYSDTGSVSAVGETWTWRVPEGDTDQKYGYKITYYTIVDESHIAYSGGDSADIGNKVTEYHSGQTASGSYHAGAEVTPTDLKVKKEFKEFTSQTKDGKTIRYAKWEISFDRRAYALKGAYLEDIHPNYGGSFEKVVVQRNEDYNAEINGISVDGLYEDENGQPLEELRVMRSDSNRTLLQFYTKNGDSSVQGLMAKDSSHEAVTVTLYTRIDENWVNNSVDRDWDIDHLNTINLFANSQKATATATCAPTVQKIVKSVENDGKPVGYVRTADSSTPLPVYAFKVKLSGVEDMVKDGKLTILDAFDPAHLRLLEDKDAVYDAETRSTEITLSGNRVLKATKGKPGADHPDDVTMDSSETSDGVKFTTSAEKLKPYAHVYELTYYLVLKDAQTAKALVDERDAHSEGVLYNGAVVSKDASSLSGKDTSGVSSYEALFDNTASVEGTEAPGTSTVDFKVDLSPIRKSAKARSDGSDLVDYTIEINPLQLRLHNGQPYEMTDSYRDMSVNFKSVKVAKCIPAENKDKISWTYHSNTGTFTIPDETYVVITYSAWPVGVRGESITMHNEAAMEGYSDYTDTVVTLDADFGGSAASYSVNVFKFGNDDMTQQKPGAIFQLYELTASGYQPMTYQAKAQTRNHSGDADYDAIANRLKTADYEINGVKVTALPTRLNHEVGDNIYFVTGTDRDNPGIAEIKLSMRRDGVALDMHKQYALVEVVPPEGYAQEKSASGGDFYWSFIIDTIDNFSGGKYVYRDGGMMSINNFQSDEVSLKLSKTWTATDAAGIVPRSVTFQLYRNGVAEGDPITMPDETGKWEATVEGLDRCDENGKEIKWTVAEVGVTYKVTDPDKIQTVTGADVGEHFDISVTTGDNNQAAATADTGWKIVMPKNGTEAQASFTNAPRKLISVTVNKQWATDDTDQIDQIVFDLYRTTEAVGEAPDVEQLNALIRDAELVKSGVVLKKSDGYATSFELMERFKDTKDYDPYHYFVVEHDAAGHTPVYARAETQGTGAQALTITNNPKDGKGKLTVTKAVTGLTPADEEYTFTVMNSGMYLHTDGKLTAAEETHTVKANETVVFDDVLPGKYTITEADAQKSGYTLDVTVNDQPNGAEIGVSGDTQVTIQNAYTPDTTTFAFSKLWIGPAAQDRKAMPWPNGKELSFTIRRRLNGTQDATFEEKTVTLESVETDGKYAVRIKNPEGDDTVSVTGNDHYIYTIQLTGLPKSDANGNLYEYYAEENGTVTGFKAPQYGFVNGIAAELDPADATIHDAAASASVTEAAINQLKLDQKFEIPVSKVLNGWLSDKELNFDIQLTGDGITTPLKQTIHQGDSCTFDVTDYINLAETLKYERSTNTYKGTYKFSVQEVTPAEKVNGVTYDAHRYEVIFDVVYDWLNSQLKVTRTIDGVKDETAIVIAPAGSAQANVTVTNTYDPGEVTLKATKVWDDDDDRDHRRADVTFKVYASVGGAGLSEVFFLKEDEQGSLVKGKTISMPLTLSATGSNAYTVTDKLPKYCYDQEISYRVVEYYAKDSELDKYYTPEGTPTAVRNGDTVVGYEVEAGRQDGTYDYTVKNTHVPETKQITVTKAWENLDRLQAAGYAAPTEIEVNLLADGNPAKYETGDEVLPLTLTKGGHWTGSWSNLPVNNKQGQHIVYTLHEADVPLGFTTADVTITHDADREPDAPKTNEDDYFDSASVTNTYEETTVTATKTWEDDHNRDDKRGAVTFKLYYKTASMSTWNEVGKTGGAYDPASVPAILVGEPEKTISAAEVKVGDTQSVSWDNLPAWLHNTKVYYKVVETKTPEGYTKTEGAPSDPTKANEANHVYTVTEEITNTHTPDKTPLNFTKEWDHKGIVEATWGNDGKLPTTDDFRKSLHLYARVADSVADEAAEAFKTPFELNNTLSGDASAKENIALGWQNASAAAGSPYTTVTAKNGALGNFTVEIHDLPAYLTGHVGWALEYFVTEEVAENYAITSAGDADADESKTSKDVTKAISASNDALTNSRDTGKLVISKALDSKLAADEKAYTFTITTTPKITGTYDEVAFNNGTATVKIAAQNGENASKEIDGLPVGVTYTVTEADEKWDNQERFTTTVNDSEGKNASQILDAEGKTFAFKNVRKVGDLEIKKTVASAVNEDKAHEFRFEVTMSGLKDDEPSRTYKAQKYVDGVEAGGQFDITFDDNLRWRVALKHNESVKILGLPTEAGYTVQEVSQNVNSGAEDSDEAAFLANFTTDKDGASGSIVADGKTADFTNTRITGALTINKALVNQTHITGDDDGDEMFTFKVTLIPEEGKTLALGADPRVMVKYGTDEPQPLDFSNNEATVTVSVNKPAVISGIPAGTKYEVQEVLNPNQKFDLVKYVDADAPAVEVKNNATFAPNRAITVDNTSDAVTYTNKRHTGGIAIRKRVESDLQSDETTRPFTFTIASDKLLYQEEYEARRYKAVNGTYTLIGTQPEKVTFTNGRNTSVTLGKDEELVIWDLPTDVKFTVTEAHDNNFAVASKASTQSTTQTTTGEISGSTVDDKGLTEDKSSIDGIIVDNKNGLITAVFKNTREVRPLEISKTVVSDVANDHTHPFSFEVKVTGLTGEAQSKRYEAQTLKDNKVVSTQYVQFSANGSASIYDDAGGTGTSATRFKLTDSQKLQILGLPTGANYVVNEDWTGEDAYKANFKDEVMTGASGTIQLTENAVGVTNERNTGTLTVSKTVDKAIPGDEDKKFKFLVALTTNGEGDVDIARETTHIRQKIGANGEEQAIEVENGKIVLWVSQSAPVTLTKVPYGVSYTVTEENWYKVGEGTPVQADNFELKTANITDAKPFVDPSTEAFTNERKVGDLSLDKSVVNSPIQDEREAAYAVRVTLKTTGGALIPDWPFTVEEKEKDSGEDASSKLNNAASYQTGADGVATITIKGDRTVTLKGLPTDATFTLQEIGSADEKVRLADFDVSYAGQYENTQEITGETGAILADDTAQMTVTNTRKLGDLEVSKTVESDVATDKTHEFVFELKLTGLNDDLVIDSDKVFTVKVKNAGVDGADETLTFAGNVARFTLKHGQSKKIVGLPEGWTYTITEVPNKVDGTEDTAEAAYLNLFTQDQNLTGTKTQAISSTDVSAIAATNTRKTGGLKISKQVKSPFDSEKTGKYSFTVTVQMPEGQTLGDSLGYAVNGVAQTPAAEVVNGVATLHVDVAVVAGRGETTITGLPVEALWTVAEETHEVPGTAGYVVTKAGEMELFETSYKYWEKASEKTENNGGTEYTKEPKSISADVTPQIEATNSRRVLPIALRKVSSAPSTDALKGAEFTLESANDSDTWTINLRSGEGGVFELNGTQTPPVGIMVTETNEVNLPVGTYKLTETKAPAGYNMLIEPVTITVSPGGVSYEAYLGSEQNAWIHCNDGQGRKYDQSKRTVELLIPNTPGVKLPSTGGPGTAVFTGLGVLLTLFAAAMLVVKRRKDQY